MIRPHPAFWRLVHGVVVVYLLAIVWLLFQDVQGARRSLKVTAAFTGRPLPLLVSLPASGRSKPGPSQAVPAPAGPGARAACSWRRLCPRLFKPPLLICPDPCAHGRRVPWGLGFTLSLSGGPAIPSPPPLFPPSRPSCPETHRPARPAAGPISPRSRQAGQSSGEQGRRRGVLKWV
mmetsp:Transcript_25323/g.60234  ORF Transcript_25323/g.60234 Transcript_25323/m.60234 type:complete len:177 (-) Transcript_25323:1332-1862(-)